MGSVSLAIFAVLINGSPSSFFKATRGLRQGCPLSPFLFNLVVESLSKLIKEAKQEGAIKDVKIADLTNLDQLFFVDDVLLFGERLD